MAPPSFFRFFRFLRSFFLPAVAIGGLCFLLTAFLVLYQPLEGPEHVQRLGWQSWSVINLDDKSSASSTGASSGTTTGSPNGSGVDWWNVTVPEAPQIDSALDVWNPLLPHDTGLSEIAVVGCAFPPSLAWGNMCKPETTSEKDAIKGKWVRVGGNLNAESSLYYIHLWYRRTRRLDVPLITAIQILPKGTEPSPLTADWYKVPRSLHEGVLRADPLFLWYRADKTRREMSEVEAREQLVTELDVLYGEGRAWYGFEKLEPATTEELPGKRDGVFVTYRKGVKPVPRAPPLHFTHDGKFKILQVADLHYSVSRGVCKDTPLAPCPGGADNLTTTLLGRVLDAERPDLVVFSGDQLNGQGTSWDARSVLAKFARGVTDRGIPWAAVFGNHDEEDGGRKEAQLRMMQALPYSLVERGPPDIHGVGNYVLKVKSADPSMMHLLTMYFLDSGAYSKGYLDWFGVHPTAYDWIHTDQIDWFLQESGSIKPIERPFTPDGAKDFGDIWARQAAGQVTSQTRRLAKPNALMFFHIPLPESYLKADVDASTGKPLDVGVQFDTPGAAKESDGFFEKGLLRALESDHTAGGRAREVKVVSNGHSHTSENCRRVRGVWLCFGGGGSYSGYGKIGFDRRFRIYDISDFGETITTYKRTEKDEVLDRMVLAGKGAPAVYEGTR